MDQAFKPRVHILVRLYTLMRVPVDQADQADQEFPQPFTRKKVVVPMAMLEMTESTSVFLRELLY
jgi:hypothetical protein